MSVDYGKFKELEAEIIAVAPDTLGNAKDYFETNKLPFVGLADNELQVFKKYDVQNRLISLGQRPGTFVIDSEGLIRYAYIGFQQWEIPGNDEILEVLKSI